MSKPRNNELRLHAPPLTVEEGTKVTKEEPLQNISPEGGEKRRIVCANFPELPGRAIQRENVLNTLDTLLEGETKIAFVDGPEGRGKTTLLSQYAMRHAHRTVALFISGESRYSYDITQIQFDLCNQLHELLRGAELRAPEEATPSLLGILMYEARRRSRRTGAPMLVIIDGLHEIPSDDVGSRRLLLDLLPIGESGFRFVFSGDPGQVGLRDKQQAIAKTYLLTLFSLDETTHFLDKLGLISAHIEELYRVSKGAPSVLASMRRLIISGESAESLLENLPTRIPQPFELEWKHVDTENEELTTLLAVLAHDPRHYSVQGVAKLLQTDEDGIRQHLSPLTFVTVGDGSHGDVRFVSDAFKRFVATKLANRNGQVSDLLIESLLAEPDSNESLDLLPAYLRAAGRLEQLLGFLTNDVMAGYVNRSASLSAVQAKAEMGIKAAKELRRDPELVRLSLQKATIAELDESEAARAELRALAALGEHTLALGIAEGATRHEDRLLLLAALARSRREAKLPIPAEVQEQLQQLHEAADFAIIADRSDTLAADLMHCRPDLALKTVERAKEARTASSTLRSADWTYAKLAIEARLAEHDTGRSADQVAEILEKIKDPKLVRLATEASVVFGDTAAEDAIREASKLPEIEDQVYVLRHWMLANRTRGDTALVLDHALAIAIRATNYTPTAKHLRELASSIPYITDEGEARRLIGIVDGQAPVVQQIGPTEDYVRLQLILARAEYLTNRGTAEHRIIDLYLFVAGLTDFTTKVTATARIVAALSRIDEARAFEAKEGLHSMAERELRELTKELLYTSADHYEATQSLVQALAINRPDIAFEVILEINTEPRRDWAYRDLIMTAARGPLEEIRFATIQEALGRIVNDDVRDDALEEVVEAVALRRLTDGQLQQVLPLLGRIGTMGSPERRAKAAAQAVAMLDGSAKDAYEAERASFLDVSVKAWEAIDEAWRRLTTAFEIAVYLAPLAPANAREFVDKAGGLRTGEALYNDASALGALRCLRLAIRAFAGLLPKNLATPAEKLRLERAIGRIPSAIAKAGLWTDLAERYHLNERATECRDVVEQRLKPLLEEIEKASASEFHQTAALCGPALYVSHRATAAALFQRLPYLWRDAALFNVAEFIKRKCPLADPFEPRGREGYTLSYNDAIDLVELMAEMDQDATIYYTAESVVDSVAGTSETLSRQQKMEIARRLNEVAATKFPNHRFIKHGGYRIALEAQVGRLKPLGKNEWAALIASARSLPNVADQAYVLAIAASCTRDAAERATVLGETAMAIERIPMLIDKVDHYRSTGALLVGVDRAASKECLRLGLQYSLQGKGSGILHSRREIVDLAYRIDPDFASKLASDIDDDPAKTRVTRQIALHQLKKSMAQERPDISAADMEDIDYSRAAWMRLSALNAGRVDHVPMKVALRYLDYAQRQPLSRAYPIFALLIENAVRRHAKTDTAKASISPFFEAALLGAELAVRTSARTKEEKRASLELVRERASTESLLVEPGQRDAGLEFLRTWLEQCSPEYLKIADPFFTPRDLDLLRLIQSTVPRCRVSILTSRRAHSEGRWNVDLQLAYADEWKRISDDAPPLCDIVAIGARNSGGVPIHDRWWLARGGGVELGTSWNGIGKGKASSLHIMGDGESDEKEHILDEFLVHFTREYKGERYIYVTASLGEEAS